MSENKAQRRHVLGAAVMLGALGLVGATEAEAAGVGLVTTKSSHTVAETIARFNTAATKAGWMVFTEIDHAAAAAKVGMKFAPRHPCRRQGSGRDGRVLLETGGRRDRVMPAARVPCPRPWATGRGAPRAGASHPASAHGCRG